MSNIDNDTWTIASASRADQYAVATRSTDPVPTRYGVLSKGAYLRGVNEVSEAPMPSPRTTRDALLDEHARIDGLLTRLGEEAEADLRPDLDQTWSELERALLAHFEAEELYLFPTLAEECPIEHAALYREHGELRRLIAEIGIGIELHSVVLTTIRELSERIRTHAQREEAILYPWAEVSQAPGPRALSARLRRA